MRHSAIHGRIRGCSRRASDSVLPPASSALDVSVYRDVETRWTTNVSTENRTIERCRDAESIWAIRPFRLDDETYLGRVKQLLRDLYGAPSSVSWSYQLSACLPVCYITLRISCRGIMYHPRSDRKERFACSYCAVWTSPRNEVHGAM